MQPDDPHTHKRASYQEQAARAGADPDAHEHEAELGDASLTREASYAPAEGSLEQRSVEPSARPGDAKPTGAGNVATGDQPPHYGAAAHPASTKLSEESDERASGGSSSSW